MVYLSPLIHPEAVNVGVQDHLQDVQGVQDRLYDRDRDVAQ